MRYIDKIIIHQSDSDHRHHDNLQAIDDWHKERGFKFMDKVGKTSGHVGYHYVITKDGEVHVGRPLDIIGAHCKGFNIDSVGICLTGEKLFSVAQFQALAGLIESINITLDKDLMVRGHNDYNKAKTCPGFDVKKFIKLYIEL
jgi:N-acetyl-anhydromuramyl-L-alanine amidase AmpD